MKIALAGTEFKFGYLSVLLYLVVLILLISLGFWQLDRAEEKKLFIVKEKLSRAKPVINLESVLNADPESIRYRKTKLTGKYDHKHQFLIDNQIVNGHVGYFVITPFIVDGMEKTVLVNRGWLALNKDRSILPDLSFTHSKTDLTGRINNFPVVGMQLTGAEIPTEGWPSVVQVIDTKVLSKRLGYSLLSFQIELDADMNNGYLREWKQSTIIPPEKHIAYAVQWFGLAITLTLLFLWVSGKK